MLVGTTSIETSERLSELLNARGIAARSPQRQAARARGEHRRAGRAAGRGHDRHQHGRPRHRHRARPGRAEAGGLHIIGTERHESRRIDNQLRGRAGRQGDPGSSRFYVSLDDELMRRFGGERIVGLMERLGMEEDVPIEHRIISKSIESAQTKVEGHNFDIRRHVVQYDDVMNRHREVIYADRQAIVKGEDMSEKIEEMIARRDRDIVERNSDEKVRRDRRRGDRRGVPRRSSRTAMSNWQTLDGLDEDGIIEVLTEDAIAPIRKSKIASAPRPCARSSGRSC